LNLGPRVIKFGMRDVLEVASGPKAQMSRSHSWKVLECLNACLCAYSVITLLTFTRWRDHTSMLLATRPDSC